MVSQYSHKNVYECIPSARKKQLSQKTVINNVYSTRDSVAMGQPGTRLVHIVMN